MNNQDKNTKEKIITKQNIHNSKHNTEGEQSQRTKTIQLQNLQQS
jgi:hypothetical protein